MFLETLYHMVFDAQTIARLAKAKRERLRQAHLAPDYIPLQGILNTASGRKKTGGIRSNTVGLKSTTGTIGLSSAPGLEGSGEGVEAGAAGGVLSSGSDEEPEEAMRLRFTVDTKQKYAGLEVLTLHYLRV
jgi:GC-rich sequence DNA-binding factor